MVLDFLPSLRRGDKKTKVEEENIEKNVPVLDAEEERFLRELAEEPPPPPLPTRPNAQTQNSTASVQDAQTAHIDGAEKVALPASPATETTTAEKQKKKGIASYFDTAKDTVISRSNSVFGKGKGKEKATAGQGSHLHADNAKASGTATTPPVTDTEAQAEAHDLAGVLDQLNLSAVNNRVFSFSAESQKLLDDFKVVLKDLVNGVPTAYDDLESLLKNSEGQIQKMFEGLPGPLQGLVKSLPAKMTAGLGPEVLAAMSEKPGADAAAHMSTSQKATKAAKSIPSLKSLVSQQGAIAAMLKSILNFLKLRFPVLMTGTNILLSLAVFILLFVFWYCHKRGKETRLEREKSSAAASAEASETELEPSVVLTPTDYYGESQRKAAAEKAAAEQGAAASQPAAVAQTAATNPPTALQPADPQVERVIESFPSTAGLPEPESVPLPKDGGAKP